MMDSTTITLFDNILKGVGRHPKSGKKKIIFFGIHTTNAVQQARKITKAELNQAA